MPRALTVVALAAAFAAGTWIAGWLAVPVLGLAFGALVVRGRPGLVLLAGLAGTLGWGALLGGAALVSPVSRLAERLGGVVGQPSWLVVAVTLVFPALLAASAAGLGSSLRSTVAGDGRTGRGGAARTVD
jgi:hypothetical protein